MSLRTKVKTVLLLAIIAVIGVAGYYSYTIIQFANKIHSSPGESRFGSSLNVKNTGTDQSGTSYVPPKWEGKERVNILLIGADSRGLSQNENPRSDTLMVASIDPVTKTGVLFSVLRDTYTSIPGHGSDKINAALAWGGTELAMKTVSDLLDLPIQYFIYTDFQGFKALIDAIGGIEFEVEKDMKYSDPFDGPEFDIDLKKGKQLLDGSKALQYVRFRNDALSDYTRTERQRNLLKTVADKLQKGSSLIRLPKILSAIDPYIETNMTVIQMLKLGALGMEANASAIEGVQLPPAKLLREETIRGASVITVDKTKLQQYILETLEQSTQRDAEPAPESPAAPSQPVAAKPAR